MDASAVAATIASLKKAKKAVDREKALNTALDALAASSSVASSQRLYQAIDQCLQQQEISYASVLPRLKSIVAISSTPVGKADYLGYALIRLVLGEDMSDFRALQRMLVEVYLANPTVLTGFLTALDSTSQEAIHLLRPTLLVALIQTPNASGRAIAKQAVIQTLVRLAWSSGPQSESIREVVSGILVRAIELFPQSEDPDLWMVYPGLVTAAADLLSSAVIPADHGSLLQSVLGYIGYGLHHELRVLPVLHAIQSVPWTATSATLVACADLLFLPQTGEEEIALLLDLLHRLLPAPRSAPPTSAAASSTARPLYLEALVLPLVVLLPTHHHRVAPLLQSVLAQVSTSSYDPSSGPAWAPPADSPTTAPPSVEAAHGASFLALVASSSTTERWLDGLFPIEEDAVEDAKAAATQPSISVERERGLVLRLAACLVDRRGHIRTRALEALARHRVVLHPRRRRGFADPTHTRAIVSLLVFLVSYRPPTTVSTATAVTRQAPASGGAWLSSALGVLAQLAASATETMALILRLVRRMAAARGLRPQALHLLQLVWAEDARVYPQLEAMLQEDEEDEGTGRDEEEEEEEAARAEWAHVRMSTILVLCERDPERGLEWIADLQGGLGDPRPAVAATAVRAIARLVAADALDFATTAKILLTKLKKRKLPSHGDPRVQRELAAVYGLGARCGGGHVGRGHKVLSALWALAEEAPEPSVRLAAVQGLGAYELATLGLVLPSGDRPRGPAAHEKEEEDEEEEEEEELTEGEVAENVQRLWSLLAAERDAAVRQELEGLVRRILIVECQGQRLGPGGGSSGGRGGVAAVGAFTLENRLSSAATKELRRHLPTRASAGAMTMCPLGELLLAEPLEEPDAASTKRKDKRRRLVQGHVEHLQGLSARVCGTSSRTTLGDTPGGLLRALQWIDAWRAFAGKYLPCLEEFALLKSPSDAPAEAVAAELQGLLTAEFEVLVERARGPSGSCYAWMALGALVGAAPGAAARTGQQLLRRELRQVLEELRVFKGAAAGREEDAIFLLIALLLAENAHELPEDLAVSAVADATSLAQNPTLRPLVRGLATLWLGQLGRCRAGDPLSMLQNSVEAIMSVFLDAFALKPRATTTIVDAMFPDSPSTGPLAADTWEGLICSKTSSTPVTADDAVVQWASCMALATLAPQFAQVQRESWLVNLRGLLEATWARASTTRILSVALGPVVIECVHAGLAPMADVVAFLKSLVSMEPPVGADSIAMLVPPYLIRRMAELYGPAAIEAGVLERVMEWMGVEVEPATEATHFADASVGILLFGSTGIVLPTGQGPTQQSTPIIVVVPWETNLVQRAVARVRAPVVTAGIADRASALCSLQKNKTFDAELPTLPPTSLVFRCLEFICAQCNVSSSSTVAAAATDTDAEEDEGREDIDKKAMVASLLRCLARVQPSASLPSLDLSPFIFRVLHHFADDEITRVVLELAAAHPSTIGALLRELYAPTRLINAPERRFAAMLEDVAIARTRLSAEDLVQVLGRLWEVARRHWATSALVQHAWIGLLSTLLTTTTTSSPLDTARMEAVKEFVVDAVLLGLPYTPQGSNAGDGATYVRRFVNEVVLKVDGTERVVQKIISADPSGVDGWAWWRSGLLLSNLVTLSPTSVPSSSIFQWLLQQSGLAAWSNGDRWSHTKIAAMLATAIHAAHGSTPNPTKMSTIGVHEARLLELLDGLVRERIDAISADAAPMQVTIRCRVLFGLVTQVITAALVQEHETFQATDMGGSRDDLGYVQASSQLLAFGLLHNRGTAVVGLWERLWALRAELDGAWGGQGADEDVRLCLEALRALGLRLQTSNDPRVCSSLSNDLMMAIAEDTL